MAMSQSLHTGMLRFWYLRYCLGSFKVLACCNINQLLHKVIKPRQNITHIKQNRLYVLHIMQAGTGIFSTGTCKQVNCYLLFSSNSYTALIVPLVRRKKVNESIQGTQVGQWLILVKQFRYTIVRQLFCFIPVTSHELIFWLIVIVVYTKREHALTSIQLHTLENIKLAKVKFSKNSVQSGSKRP